MELSIRVDTAQLPAGLILEARYLRTVRDDIVGVARNAGTAEQPVEDRATVAVPASVRLPLDAAFPGTVALPGLAPAPVTLAVLGVGGSTLWSRQLQTSDLSDPAVTLDAPALTERAAQAQQLPGTTIAPDVVRAIKLVPTSEVAVDFTRSAVAVLPVADDTLLKAVGLQSDGSRTATLEATGQALELLRALAFTPATLALDGVVTARFEKQEQALGWVWWLTGPHQVVGFVPDKLLDPEARRHVIPLPALAPSPAKDEEPPERPGRVVPADVTESEIVDNPEVFTEDPGAFCRPFSNPERVVGEKSFSVIARITQPDISPLASRRTKTLSILGAETLKNTVERPRGLFSRVASTLSGQVATTASTALARFDGGLVPVRYRPPREYLDFIDSLPSGRTALDAAHPLQWEDDIAQYQAATVALGHILEYRVRWRSNGYSLGTVASTLTLAPRQMKRVQKIEWERSERAARRETTELRDQENDSVVRERDYTDTVSANLSEWARGSSSSSAAAVAGGIGFFAPGILGGIGGGASSAHSTSHQSGGRDTTASEQQRLRDAIRRHGDALRKLESTVVTEVSQEESVTGTTEVIRNANYEHSLTVIYYQILRHLKVTTEFSGVRECIFVPFSVKPFNVHRAYRWRESLQVSMRSPRFSRGLRHLKDVATGFATSDIAPGTRASQPLTYLRGSLYVSLGVERPGEGADGAFDSGLWSAIQPLLDTPARGIFALLSSLAAGARDQIFQSEHAPGLAARWADRLQLRVGNRVLAADFTLASRYGFNRSARIDFAVPASELAGLTRESIQQLRVTATSRLTPGSVANLTRMSVVYSTARHEHSVEGRSGTADLVTPMSGAPGSATVSLPLDSWERVNERQEITRAVEELIEHLNEHVEYYTKAVLWRTDRDRLLMMLDGFYVPGTNDVAIASVVDREPVGIIGNSLVYRVGAASFIGYGKVDSPAALYNVYASSEPVSDPVLVSLPTDGLYAQTILDECAALEEHYGNTDWVLSQPDPELGVIDPSLLITRRAETSQGTAPTPFPSTIINLQNAPDAPEPQGLAGVLGAVTNANAFRDMAGLAGTQSNAMTAFNAAAGLATNFGNQAAALELAKLAKAQEATKTADQKLASIQKSVDKGLATPEDAAKATKDVLSAMNPDTPKSSAPHEDEAISAAITAATAIPGSTVEANTGEGVVKVALGGERTASTGEPLKRVCGYFGPNDVRVTDDELREAVRDSAVAQRAKWWNVAVLKEDENPQFPHLVSHWLASKSAIRPTTLTGLQANAAAMSDADFGHLLTPNATGAQINAAVAAARVTLLQNVADATGPATLNNLIDSSLKSARLSRNDVLPGGPWSAVFVSDCVRSALIDLGLEAFTGGAHIGQDEYLTVSSAHRIYTLAAFRARFGPDAHAGTYHAFEPADIELRIGDIIVQDRRGGIGINDVLHFDDIPSQLTSDFPLHADIVVDVPAGGDYVEAIGGNIDNSSRIRRFPLDADRRLVVSRTELYVTEDDTQAIAALPRQSNAAGLGAESTGRIFAVLSPVPVCAVVPGQEYHGGVVA